MLDTMAEERATGADEAERDLVGRARRGDRGAFDRLVSEHLPRVWRVVWRIVRHQADAEDVAQEAFVKAYVSLGDLRNAERFGTWLYGIAFRASLDRLRQRARTGGAISLDRLRESGGEPRAPGDGAVPQAERREHALKVQEAVGALPDKYRLVLTLRYQKLMSYRDIAQHLGEPAGTISNRIHRAIGMLRDRLKALVAP